MSLGRPTIAAYVYTGWHAIPERDAAFEPGFTEWDLVESCRPRFADHHQPKVPALGRYDDRDPVEVDRRIRLAVNHGVDALIYGFFWCRGKRVFENALDRGYLASPGGRSTPFALMWANRMPRRVLPVRRTDLPVIAGDRLVSSDVEDFAALIAFVADHYFGRPNYLCVEGRPYFSIFDSTFFIRELGLEQCREAIQAARRELTERGLPDIHLAAIDPSAEVITDLADLGFDSVTHYVLLPEWKGPSLQDYRGAAAARAEAWPSFAARSGLPYMPSIAPGWDASPRGADFGPARPDKYPWSPVVTGEHPELFAEALARGAAATDELLMVASLNEWSEGHYLEPDLRFGNGWLDAIASVR